MPFLAVHRITQTAVFDPPDPYGVTAASSRLRERWWSTDDGETSAIAAEVRTLLADYVASLDRP